MTRLFLLLKGYGSTREKLLFLASLAVLGIFILMVYVICQMVQGVQQVKIESEPLDEDGNPYILDGLNDEMPALTDSYNDGHHN